MLICVGIPCYDGKPTAQTVDSLLAEQLLGYDQGVHFLVVWEIGCALVGLARNRIARKFLDCAQADCLVMVDADISWPPGTLARLAQRPEDVIGGTYRAKSEREQWHVFGEPERDGDRYRVDGLPGGFLKISRKALESIDANAYADNAGKVWRDYFPTGFYEGRFYGEDYGFCRLCRQAGGSVFLDPSIILRHHDGQRMFTGDPKVWLETR